MARIEPFRAVRYDTRKVDLGQVIAPPYDVVARDERGDLYDRDPYNAVRLELTRRAEDEAATDYGHVREILDGWTQEGVLIRDEKPALYVLRQSYKAPDGGVLSREGFFAAVQLEAYENRVVRPHERTLAGPKADRLRLLRATRANLSPIFMLYEDREEQLTHALSQAFENAEVSQTREVAGVSHSLVALRDTAAIDSIRNFLADRPLVIADGHHRYETALAYRDERRKAEPAGTHSGPYESTLVYLANAFAPGSLLLPIHRVVKKGGVPTAEAYSQRLPGWSSKTVAVAGEAEIHAVLDRHLAPLARRPSFAADDGSGSLRIFWRDEELGQRLMVEILEEQVIGGVFGLGPDAIRDGAVGFPKSAERAALEVRGAEGTVALYLNPLHAEDVFRVTAAGKVMPQKSTFFAPKIPTGLVFRVEESL